MKTFAIMFLALSIINIPIYQIYSAANEVTVRIYIGGVLEYEDSKMISGENSYTHFASIDWDDEPVVIPH